MAIAQKVLDGPGTALAPREIRTDLIAAVVSNLLAVFCGQAKCFAIFAARAISAIRTESAPQNSCRLSPPNIARTSIGMLLSCHREAFERGYRRLLCK